MTVMIDHHYLSHELEKLLARGTEQIISARFLQCQIDYGFQGVKFDEMSEKIAVIEPECYPKEAESS